MNFISPEVLYTSIISIPFKKEGIPLKIGSKYQKTNDPFESFGETRYYAGYLSSGPILVCVCMCVCVGGGVRIGTIH